MDREIQAAVSALGCLDGDKYDKEPDCLETVKDLIRYLRRDIDTSSDKVRRQLTSLNVVEKDLIPILRCYSNDAALFEATLRLLINLTQPLAEKPSDKDGAEIPQRPSTILSERLQLLSDMKRTKRVFANLDLFVVLTEKLKPLLRLDWEQRQEEDRLLIERLLIFIRNILHIPPPDEDIFERSSCNLTAHDHTVWVLHKSKFMDLLLEIVCADAQREFHVHALEIISLLLRQHSPEVLASVGVDHTAADRRKEQEELASIHAMTSSQKLNQMRRCSGRHTAFSGAYTVYGVKGLNATKDLVSPRPLLKSEDLSFESRKQRRKIPRNKAPALETIADPTSYLSSSGSGGRSAVEIGALLREFCDRFIDGAYNRFMHSVQYSLERRSETADGSSRYQFWWLMRYFMAFVRCSGGKDGSCLRWRAVSETLSLQCLHEAQKQLEECLDMVKMEKKDSRRWGRKAHVILKAYGELLIIIHVMEKGNNEEAIDVALELKKTIFYVMEYRELLISLLKRYNPAVFTKSYLKDLIEITHVYLKMFESHCLVYGDELLVQKKQKRRRRRRRSKAKNNSQNEDGSEQPRGPDGLTDEERRIRLDGMWDNLADDLSTMLQNVEKDPSVLPVDVVAFDALAEHGFGEKTVAQVRIQNALKSNDMPKSIALLRLSRQIWPEEAATFGTPTPSGPEDDFLLLRHNFFSELPIIPGENDSVLCAADGQLEMGQNDYLEPKPVDGGASEFIVHGDPANAVESDSEDDGHVVSEVQFSFNQYVQRFTHCDILCCYISMLAEFQSNTAQFNHYLIKMLHRIAYDLKLAPLLYQARLFRVFQKLTNTPGIEHYPGANELLTFAKHHLTGFFRKASKDKTVIIEMLFWKNFKDAYEIEYGYGSYECEKKTKPKRHKKVDDDEGETSDREAVSSRRVSEDFDVEFQQNDELKLENEPKRRKEKVADEPAILTEEGEAPAVTKKKKKKETSKTRPNKDRWRKAMASVGRNYTFVPLEEVSPRAGTNLDNEIGNDLVVDQESPESSFPLAETNLDEETGNDLVVDQESPESPPAQRKRRAFAISSDDEDDG